MTGDACQSPSCDSTSRPMASLAVQRFRRSRPLPSPGDSCGRCGQRPRTPVTSPSPGGLLIAGCRHPAVVPVSGGQLRLTRRPRCDVVHRPVNFRGTHRGLAVLAQSRGLRIWRPDVCGRWRVRVTDLLAFLFGRPRPTLPYGAYTIAEFFSDLERTSSRIHTRLRGS